jgi:hypothetical protein
LGLGRDLGNLHFILKENGGADDLPTEAEILAKEKNKTKSQDYYIEDEARDIYL